MLGFCFAHRVSNHRSCVSANSTNSFSWNNFTVKMSDMSTSCHTPWLGLSWHGQWSRRRWLSQKSLKECNALHVYRHVVSLMRIYFEYNLVEWTLRRMWVLTCILWREKISTSVIKQHVTKYEIRKKEKGLQSSPKSQYHGYASMWTQSLQNRCKVEGVWTNPSMM